MLFVLCINTVLLSYEYFCYSNSKFTPKGVHLLYMYIIGVCVIILWIHYPYLKLREYHWVGIYRMWYNYLSIYVSYFLVKYQMDILENLRKVNCDYYQVGWYQSTYLSSHFTKDFFESQIPYQTKIMESVVIVYGMLLHVLHTRTTKVHSVWEMSSGNYHM